MSEIRTIKRADKWFQILGNKIPFDGTKYDSIGRIAYIEGNVKNPTDHKFKKGSSKFPRNRHRKLVREHIKILLMSGRFLVVSSSKAL